MQTTPGRSHPLSDRASLDLDLLRYLSILKSRWLLVGFIMLGSVGLAALMAFTRPSTYEADAKLLVEIDRTSSLTGFGEGVGQLDPLVNAQNPLSTELQIITSRPVLQRVVETLNLKNASGEPLEPKDIQERLGAQILGGADVIQISFAHSDPEIAAVIVNTLADVYISNNIDDNTAKSGKALQLVEARLPESEAFVSKAEAELRNFKESNGIVSLPEEAAATVTTLEALESQSLATAVELREAQVRSQQLQSS
ncbi:MAG: Wzz/FepE/Etk N-terminal domain-containing protein, partial [Cyanobacteria bacterium J06576_12]